MALPHETLSRTWGLDTPANGTYFQTEFSNLLENDEYLDGRLDGEAPVAFTPTTQGIGTPTSVNCFSNRNGSWLEGWIDLTLGTVTGSEMRIGFKYNGSEAVTASSDLPAIMIQQVNYVASGGSAGLKYAVLIEAGATYFTFGYDSAPLTKRNGNTFGGSGDRVCFQFRIPIQEWA